MAARSSGAHPVLPRGFGCLDRSGRLPCGRRNGRELGLAAQTERTCERTPPDCEIEAGRVPVEVGTPAGKDGPWVSHQFGTNPDHSE